MSPIRRNFLLAAREVGSKAIEVAGGARIGGKREALDLMIEAGATRKPTWAVENGGRCLWKLDAT